MRATLFFPVIIFLVAFISFNSFSQQKIFEYTGDVQTYIVPQGVSTISVDMFGASGGWNDYSGVRYDKYVPGKGGRLQASFPVSPGQTLYIYVGGIGENATTGRGGSGGFNGGGNGNSSDIYSGGGGGGASDIRIDGKNLENRVLVVGGGGGAAYNYPDGGDNGGQGGDLTGADGESNFMMEDESRGRGATQTQGGLGGQWSGYEKAEDGEFGRGGNGPKGTSGTGGGGGYYGGGGGCWSGGGGGSSYSDKRASNIKHEQGVNEGNGKVIIIVNCKMPMVEISGPTTFCQGQSISFNAKSNYGANLSWDKGVQNNISFIPPAGKTIYTITSSNPKECSYSVELNVGAGALKATTTNGIICEGESTTLIGFGGENYTWTSGAQNNVPFVPPVGVNNYTVRSSGSESSNCATEASVFVVVNKVKATADVQQATVSSSASIDLTPTGGTFPYTFIWKKNGIDFAKTEDLYTLAPATYEVIIVDAIGCSTTQSFTITGSTIYNPQSTSLKAEMSADQIYLNISFNGYFEYKIQNEKGELVMTGAVNNSGKIDVSKLPKGKYRICSLYNTTTDGVNFVKS